MENVHSPEFSYRLTTICNTHFLNIAQDCTAMEGFFAPYVLLWFLQPFVHSVIYSLTEHLAYLPAIHRDPWQSMTVPPHHSVISEVLLNVYYLYETMCVLAICRKHLDSGSQHSFVLKESRECSNFMWQSIALFDTDQTAKKQKEQWQLKKSSNCESKPKWTEGDISDSRFWQFTLSLSIMRHARCLTYLPHC